MALLSPEDVLKRLSQLRYQLRGVNADIVQHELHLSENRKIKASFEASIKKLEQQLAEWAAEESSQ